MTNHSPTLIIGAGPAGLAMAGQLSHAGLPFTLLEQSEAVGYAWRNHYDRLHLHTVKQYSALPHLPYPADYPVYVSRQQLVDYLEGYCRHFGIEPLFGQSVQQIRREDNGRWTVTTVTDRFTADRVVVATGYNRVPFQPSWPGQDAYRGVLTHSRAYRNGAAFRGKRVLVIGMGNTGAELALDLYEHGAQPFISVRSPVNIVKRDVFGRPAPPTAIFLNKFPNWFYDLMAGLSQRLSIGDLSAYGLQKPPYPPSYQIRALGKIPVIDLGTLDQIKAGNIRVVPGVDWFTETGVRLSNGESLAVDGIIVATGYRPGLGDFFSPELREQILNEKGYPKALWFGQPGLQGLYFIGFSTPLTGILYNIGKESEQLIRRLQQSEVGQRTG